MEGGLDGFCGTTVISYRGRGHNEPSRDQPLQDMKPTCTHREVGHVFCARACERPHGRTSSPSHLWLARY